MDAADNAKYLLFAMSMTAAVMKVFQFIFILQCLTFRDKNYVRDKYFFIAFRLVWFAFTDAKCIASG